VREEHRARYRSGKDPAPTNTAEEPKAAEASPVPCSLRQFLRYFLDLGTLGFGGSIALAGQFALVLDQGRLVESGAWKELLIAPESEVLKVFGQQLQALESISGRA
jgi:hypothetical protein